MVMRHIFILFFLLSCSSQFKKRDVLGERIISFSGKTLLGEVKEIPMNNIGNHLLIFGFVQDSQFDIDRWLIGLDMIKSEIVTYEVAAIKGLFPRMFKSKIDEGMRKGIPKKLWGGVITAYKDGESIQRYFGNKNPNNARVVLVNNEGKILFFRDSGFSVEGLKKLKTAIEKREEI